MCSCGDRLVEKIPQLDECCCLELLTGCKISACVDLVISFMYSALMITTLMRVNTSSPGDLIAPLLVLAITLTMFIMAILLLIGLSKENMGLIKWWVLVKIIEILAITSGGIFGAVNASQAGGPAYGVQMIAMIIIVDLGQLFMLIIVKSYRHKVIHKDDNAPVIPPWVNYNARTTATASREQTQ